MVLDDGTTIEIGGADKVMSSMAFAQRVYAATGHVLPLVKRERWMAVCRALAAMREFVPNPSTTRKGQAEEWIGSYLLNNPVAIDEGVEIAATNGTPFWEDGWLYIWATNLRRHVGLVLDERFGQTARSYSSAAACGSQYTFHSPFSLSSRKAPAPAARSVWRSRASRSPWP